MGADVQHCSYNHMSACNENISPYYEDHGIPSWRDDELQWMWWLVVEWCSGGGVVRVDVCISDMCVKCKRVVASDPSVQVKISEVGHLECTRGICSSGLGHHGNLSVRDRWWRMMEEGLSEMLGETECCSTRASQASINSGIVTRRLASLDETEVAHEGGREAVKPQHWQPMSSMVDGPLQQKKSRDQGKMLVGFTGTTTSGKWKQFEYQSLFDLVNLDLRMKAFQEKKSNHAVVCLPYWNNCLLIVLFRYARLATPMVKEGRWNDLDDYKMIDAYVNSIILKWQLAVRESPVCARLGASKASGALALVSAMQSRAMCLGCAQEVGKNMISDALRHLRRTWASSSPIFSEFDAQFPENQRSNSPIFRELGTHFIFASHMPQTYACASCASGTRLRLAPRLHDPFAS
ncbi:hypothetical protein KSP39_PZI013752 [Platanthera zijinensis]|uniref:Uncharacterized protein n=1 Tax=Platanthera zijinensis TaxID=2320716 RepID=A0AAP0BD92_9ASPA